MIDVAPRQFAWATSAPTNARPLRQLLLSHPRFFEIIAREVGAKGVVTQPWPWKIVADLGNTGFDVCEEGIDRWTLSDDWISDAEDDGRFYGDSESIAPWATSQGLGATIWFWAIQDFDRLIRAGRLDLAGRFEGYSAPSCYIPPGAIDKEVWNSPKVDFQKGTIVLNNGEIVYDVHIVRSNSARQLPLATKTGWTVEKLTQWIRDGVARSPLVPGFTKKGLFDLRKKIGLSKDQIEWCWKLAFADQPPAVVKKWRTGGQRPNQSYPGIE